MTYSKRTTFLGLVLTVASGCGSIQWTVDGQPRGATRSSEAAGDGAAVGTSAEDTPAGRELRLGESMPTPAVLAGEFTEQATRVSVTSSKPRTISVFVLGGPGFHRNASRRREHVEVSPDKPLHLEVDSGGGTRTLQIVAIDDAETVLDHSVVYGRPADDASIAERDLYDWSLLFVGSRLDQRVKRAPAFTGRLFSTIDDDFFVYASKEQTCNDATGSLRVGEPLLLLAANVRGPTTADVRLWRANGEWVHCYLDGALEGHFSIRRPSEVVMPPATPPRTHLVENLWQDEEFLAQAATNPRIAAYQREKTKVEACFDREWSKHDPDSVANRYDVVRFDADGNVKRVEGLADRIMRKVDAACKVTALERERTAIRKMLADEGKAASEKSLQDIEARFRRSEPSR